jgi:hypothetical protein
MAFRIAGSLSLFLSDVLLLEEDGLFDAVGRCLGSPHKGREIHIFASASAAYPPSARMLAAIPALSKRLKDPGETKHASSLPIVAKDLAI